MEGGNSQFAHPGGGTSGRHHVLHDHAADQQAEVVELDPVGGAPGQVLQRPAARAEGGDRGPVRPGQLEPQLQRLGQPGLFRVEQAEQPGALGRECLDRVQGDRGEVQVGRVRGSGDRARYGPGSR